METNDPPMFPLCAIHQLDPGEARRRRSFLGFDAADEECLAAIHEVIQPDADAIIDEFYAHLHRFEELHPFLSDKIVLERLKHIQRRYLRTLGQGADRPAYFEDRLRIGTTHERVGLPQKWYLGAYVRLFELIGARLAARHADHPERVGPLLTTLQKIFTLDSILAVETYYHATMQRLEGTLRQLTQAQHELQEWSRRDGLTGINNRSSLLDDLERELRRSQRFNRPFSLLFIDVDRFKAVNDRYGHAVGDMVLRAVVAGMRRVLRPADLLGRYGGDEFLAGLTEADGETAGEIAERLRRHVAASPVDAGGQPLSVTITVGVATLQSGDEPLAELIERADQAMYRAKRV